MRCEVRGVRGEVRGGVRGGGGGGGGGGGDKRKEDYRKRKCYNKYAWFFTQNDFL